MAQRDLVEQKGNQILHIRGDSDSDLEALFKAVMNPSVTPSSTPMRLRKLPNSFFKPPDVGSKTPLQNSSVSHSRESSADSTTGVSAAAQPSGNPALPILHSRAHSSPASVQRSLVTNAQHQHLRQQSYDITDDAPLPAGWGMATTETGQRYFLNHTTHTTTWDDPRKKLNSSSMLSLGPLPDGWEQATTNEGEIYFINHQTRSTTWFDPRIPMQMQRSVLTHLPPQHGTAICSPTQFTNTNQINIQERQQRVRLQRLQMERERLRLKEEAIRQEMLIRQTIGEGVIASSPTGDLPPTTTTGLDPFLGSNEFHSRQESTDSGLGMGNNYSLPHTPEDYLSTMEDSMEPSSDTDGSISGVQHIGNDLGSLNLHAADLNNLAESNMDSDDLEPSLQVQSLFFLSQ